MALLLLSLYRSGPKRSLLKSMLRHVNSAF